MGSIVGELERFEYVKCKDKGRYKKDIREVEFVGCLEIIEDFKLEWL